jgi:hypothetical protein
MGKNQGSADESVTDEQIAEDEQFFEDFGPRWGATVDQDGE